MSITTTANRKDYAGDGVTTTFAFPYRFLQNADLLVKTVVVATGVESSPILDTNYTVAGAGLAGGGSITFAAPPAIGVNIAIIDDPDPLQPTVLPEHGDLPAKSLETMVDRCILVVQALGERLARTVLLPVTSTIVNLLLPAPAAGKFLRWRADLLGIENADLVTIGSLGVPVSTVDGGTGGSYATVALLFAGIKQAATTAVTGVGKIATQLVADAGTDALDWITASTLWTTKLRGGWKNIVGANGGFEVWQRGAGGAASIAVPASSSVYGPDRWYLSTGANQISTLQEIAGLTSQSKSACRVIRNAGQTGTGFMIFGFPLDTDEIIKLRGRKVTIRFVARGGANWSPVNGLVNCGLFVGTGAVAKRAQIAYTGEQSLGNVGVQLTPGGGAVTVHGVMSVALPTNITQADLLLSWQPTGTAGAFDGFDVDDVDVRLDEPTIDQFERRPFENELRACMRHFWKTFPYATAPAQNAGDGVNELNWRTPAGASANTSSGSQPHPVPMRVTPTATTFNPAAANAEVRNATDGADCSATSVGVTPRTFNIICTTSAGTAANEILRCHVTMDAGI